MDSPTDPLGTHLYATLISHDPDLSVFRRFSALNVRNILYLQSELGALEAHLLRLDAQANDISKGNDVWAMPRSWRAVKKAGLKAQAITSAATDDETKATDDETRAIANGEMYRTVQELRAVLREYNDALQAQAWLHSRKPPNARARRALGDLLAHNRYVISEEDADYLSEPNQDDLVSLAPGAGKEALTRFLENRLSSYFQTAADKKRSQTNPAIDFFSESRVRLTVRLLAIILSTLLPVLSIVALYFVNSNNIRLGLIVVFSILCSAILALVSDARNIEIIAASAAYAAVQVVFVGANFTPSN